MSEPPDPGQLLPLYNVPAGRPVDAPTKDPVGPKTSAADFSTMITAGRPPPLSLGKRLRVTALVWLAMVGLDFLLNGAVFAQTYKNGGTFLLPPTEAFQRIPLGYLALVVLALSVVEMAHRLRITRIVAGMRLGVAIGGVFGATWALSLYSIATLTADTAIVFAAVWLALLTLAGAVAASGLAQDSVRGLALRVVGLDVVCAVIVVTLQSLDLVS